MSDDAIHAPDLSRLHTVQADFATVVKRAKESEDSDAPRVDLLYIRFLENIPDEQGLAEVARHQILNYALPKKHIEAATKAMRAGSLDGSQWSKLLSEAKSAFIKYNNQSPQSEIRYAEIGEVISFCLASHYLSAGQVAAKMALKTNSEMPVFGVDGIHVRDEGDGTISVFFLESKMVGDEKDGANQYVQSASGFDGDRKHKLNELRIARDLSNLDIISEEGQATAIEYFNPYSRQRGNVRERFVGVIIYNEEIYKEKIPVTDSTPIHAHEKHFEDKYIPKHEEISKHLKSVLEKKKAEPGRCRAFFLAVPDISKLRSLFAEAMKA